MGLRLAGIAIGAQWGVTAAVVGVVLAQAITTASILGLGVWGLRRFPSARPVPLGDDRGPLVRFVAQSAAYTGLISVRTWVAPLTLGIVRSSRAVGLFRAAQMPQTGLAALSSPLRMILLSEQTRDWEHGRPQVVLAAIRRYVKGVAAIAAIAIVPLLLLLPWLVRVVLGARYLPAVPAARLIVVAGAIQLVLSWTKTFPVTIGRPGLRLVAHGVETAVMLPLIVVFGKEWGVTGAGAAVLVSTVAFAATWAVILVRLRRGGLGSGAAVTITARWPSAGSSSSRHGEARARPERLQELCPVVDDRGGRQREQSRCEAAHHRAVERVEEVEDRAVGRQERRGIAAEDRDVRPAAQPACRLPADLGIELDPLDPVTGIAVEEPVQRPPLPAPDVDDDVLRAAPRPSANSRSSSA